MMYDRLGGYAERHRSAWQDGGRTKLPLKFHKSLGDMTAVINEIHKYASKRRDNAKTGGVVLYDYKW